MKRAVAAIAILAAAGTVKWCAMTASVREALAEAGLVAVPVLILCLILWLMLGMPT